MRPSLANRVSAGAIAAAVAAPLEVAIGGNSWRAVPGPPLRRRRLAVNAAKRQLDVEACGEPKPGTDFRFISTRRTLLFDRRNAAAIEELLDVAAPETLHASDRMARQFRSLNLPIDCHFGKLQKIGQLTDRIKFRGVLLIGL